MCNIVMEINRKSKDFFLEDQKKIIVRVTLFLKKVQHSDINFRVDGKLVEENIIKAVKEHINDFF